MFGFNKLKSIEKWGDNKNTGKLIKELSNKNPEIRAAAAKALEKTGDYNAVTALVTALSDTDMNVKFAVAEALGNIGDPRAKEYLRYIADKDQNEKLKEIASKALAKIAGKDL